MLNQEKWKGPTPTEEFHRRFEETLTEIENLPEKKRGAGFARRKLIQGCAAAAACTAFFAGICAANPVWASELPVIGELFQLVEEKLSFSGDYDSYMESVKTEGSSEADTDVANASQSASDQGITIKASEAYCNGTAMYVSFSMESQEPFQETMEKQDGNPSVILDTELQIQDGEVLFYPLAPEGSFTDDHTYVGMIRLELGDLGLGQAPGENFLANFHITEIVGDLKNPDRPDTGYTEEELAAMSEEEWRQVTREAEDKGEWNQYPNAREHWWTDGSWEFTVEVPVNLDQVQTVELMDAADSGIGIESVTLTPFEISLKELDANQETATMPVMMDADFQLLNGGVNVTTAAVGGHDLSTVYIYICDYTEYMDQLKPQYYNGEIAEEEFRNLLEEKALYKTEVHFDHMEN